MSTEYGERGSMSRMMGSSDLQAKPPEISKEDSRDDEEVFQRTVQYAKDKLFFEYGTLKSDAPIQLYLEELVRRLKLPEGAIIPHVAADWKEANAVCLPDGTVVVSRRLLDEADNEEEILGVLAHEYIHAKREHAKKSKELSKGKPNTETILRDIGQQRMQEYEADLRGTIEVLSKAGISPLGFKNSFEKKARKDDAVGLVHGDNLQRALNIGSALHMIDLGEVSGELTPVNKELLKVSELDIGKPSFSNVTKDMSGFGNAYRTTLQKARRELLPKLSGENRRIAASQVYLKWGAQSSQEKSSDDALVLQQLLPTEPDLLKRALVTELFYGVPAFSDNVSVTRDEYNRLESMVKTPEDVENLRKKMEELIQEKPVPYALENSIRFWTGFLYFLSRKGFFLLKDDKGDGIPGAQAEYEKYIVPWFQTMADLSKIFDLNRVSQAADFEQSALHILERKNETTKVVLARRLGFELDSEASARFETLSPEIQTWIKRVYKNSKSFDFKTAALCSDTELEAIFSNGSADEVIDIINGISNEYDSYTKARDPFEHAHANLNAAAIFILLRQCVNSLPQFALLENRHKQLLLLASANRLNLQAIRHIGESDLRNVYVKKSDNPENNFKNKVDVLNHFIETACDPTALFGGAFKQIDEVQGYLLTPEKQLPDASAVTKKQVGNVSTKNEQLLTIWLDQYFATSDLDSLTNELDAWKVRGLDLQALLGAHPEFCARINLKLADAVADGSVRSLTPKQIFALSALIPNIFLRTQFERFALNLGERHIDFETKLGIYLPQPGENGLLDLQAREDFIDHDVYDQERFATVKERIEKTIDDILGKGRVGAGVWVLLDYYQSSSETNLELLEALLKSGQSDHKLKEAVYNAVNGNLNYKMGFSGTGNTDDIAFQNLDLTTNKISQSITRSETVLRLLYSLDRMGKELILRKLMASPKGALPNRDTRDKFLTMFLDELVEDSSGTPADKSLADVLDKIHEVLVILPEWQLLYFGLRGVLAEKLAKAPAKKTKWNDIYSIEEDMEIAELKQSQLDRIIASTVWKKIPDNVDKKPDKFAGSYALYAEDRMQQVLNSAEGSKEISKTKKMSPLEFIKEVVSHTGALGVRFLQQLPLIADMPPEHVQEFSKIYDQVNGQSKLAALTLLEREWPGLWQDVEKIGRRIGGGSMVTVYEIINSEQKEEVVKVRNPNIHYHINEMYRFACQILDKLAREGGTYRAARLLLDDIKEWVDNDLGFANFLAEDALFRDGSNEQHGYQGYQPEGFDYKIKIPLSKGPANPYFSREEKIVGTNLTKWHELAASGHDMKQVTSLLVRFYADQILQGMCLSDVHPGNFAVTANKELAVFDRNYFIHLSDEERGLILSLLNPYSDISLKEDLIINFVAPKSTPRDRIAIKKLTGNLLRSLAEHDSLSAQKDLIEIRQQPGVKIPLSFTLTIKNLHALQLMARQAGFSGGISEAFAFTP